jgi:protein-tyrosine-phosphatase
MAEGILRKLAADSNAESGLIESVSAGTMGLVGMPAAQKAIDVSAEYGVDLSRHSSQAATRKLLYNADLILVLADDHYTYCLNLEVPEEGLFLLRAFPQHTDKLREMSVPDPIGQGRDVYQEAFFQIDEALRQSFPEILNRARAKAGMTG